ncbi:hypothetical protein HZS_7688 [Henneguya salminicola]|nr:hypothetical protein HZS_7688 [Henneguya salminicola]
MLIDAKVQTSHFDNKIIIKQDYRTIMIVNPNLFEGRALLRMPYKSVTVQKESLGICTIIDIVKCNMNSFCGQSDVYVTKMSIDSQNIIIKKCIKCEILATNNVCSNPLCESFNLENFGCFLEYNLYISVSDSSGTIDGLIVSNNESIRLLRGRPEKFSVLKNEEKLEIKWNLLFQKFRVSFVFDSENSTKLKIVQMNFI